jgi:hypothetical protein
MAQVLRLTEEEAAEQVRQRDARRAALLTEHLHRPAADPTAYDLVLNSARLGEELCADLIAQAARLKLDTAEFGSPPPDEER